MKVQKSSFKNLSNLIHKEDWIAIWLGFTVITLSLLGLITGRFSFNAAKLPLWGTTDYPYLFSIFSNTDLLLGLFLTFLFLALLFSIGVRLKGQSITQFIVPFTGIFFLAFLSYLFSQHSATTEYLGYAFWALLIGMVMSNVFNLQKWLKPALQSEFFIKTGLVMMGTEVLFSNITSFGLYGLGIAWLVTPVVIIFMWLFGTKLLKMSNKTMVIVIACATAVCGTSAAIATSAACRGKKDDLTFAVGLSLIFTVIMMVTMPLLIKWLGMDPLIGGAWIGGTIDATGAVVLAGEALGKEGAQVAALVKMIQNILIGFISFGVALFFTTRVDNTSNERVGLSEIWHRFPKFILGFIFSSLLFSFIIQPILGVETTQGAIKAIGSFRSWAFCLAFVCIGLDTNFKDLSAQFQGGKPLTLYVVGQLFNIILTLAVAWLLLSGVLFPIPHIAL